MKQLFNNNKPFNFFLLVCVNLLIIFQIFFSSFLILSSKLDEEFIIMISLLLVFLISIKLINASLKSFIKIKFDIYLNSFILIFEIFNKILKKNYKLIFLQRKNRTLLIIFLKDLFNNNNKSLNLLQSIFINYQINILLFLFNEFLLYNFNFKNLVIKKININVKVKQINFLKLILIICKEIIK
jgi:hypothetical protein